MFVKFAVNCQLDYNYKYYPVQVSSSRQVKVKLLLTLHVTSLYLSAVYTYKMIELKKSISNS